MIAESLQAKYYKFLFRNARRETIFGSIIITYYSNNGVKFAISGYAISIIITPLLSCPTEVEPGSACTNLVYFDIFYGGGIIIY